MRLLSIASGSSGNSIYLGSESTGILIDAGISMKRIEAGLAEADTGLKEVDAILITHEHSDHIKSLGPIVRKYGIDVYATAGTLEAVKSDPGTGTVPEELLHTVVPDIDLTIGDITVHPFRTYHDAKDPCGFRLTDGMTSAAVATDIGHYDDYIIGNLRDLDMLLIEANHDIHMLEAGPYPYYLKRRILGDFGHLSNENCGRLLSEVLHEGLSHILLGHLSKENNYPDLAYEAVRYEIHSADNAYEPDDFDIEVALRDRASRVFEV